jgi:PAS domain S-box-containing protein
VRVRTRYQVASATAAVGLVFFFRLTRLPGASPYELFLLLNIAIAILCNTRALLTSAVLGLAGGQALIVLESGRFFTSRYWTLTIAYSVFSALLLTVNYVGRRISARAKRERRLKDAIVSSSLDAIVSMDDAGRFVDFNRAAVRMFGYHATEVVGRPMPDVIIAPDFRDALNDEWTATRPTIIGRVVEMRAIRKDGRIFPIELAVVRVDLSDRQFFIGHIRDITDRKQHEEERERLLAEAEKANGVKDELLANLSHEFRTPLNAILGWSTMLKRQQVPPDRLSHVAEVIERNAQAQSRLVDDLLDASLAVAGVLRLHAATVDLASSMHAAADSMRPASDAKGVALECVATPALGTINVDAARLHQILINLLSNAVKFTPVGGRITLSAIRQLDTVTIQVADTGIGIQPEFLPFVFERFRQADTSTTRHHGGIGLGLAVVKHLIAVMGGEITAESEGPSKGATFSVKLPAHRSEAAARTRADKCTEGAEVTGRDQHGGTGTRS